MKPAPRAFWRAAYAADVAAMKLLVSYGADPSLPTMKLFSRRGPEDPVAGADKSGLPPIVDRRPGATPLHAAAGPGYATGLPATRITSRPAGMLPAVKYLVEELGADVNAVDADGNTAVHHAASRGDNEMIRYLVVEGRRREEGQSLGPDDDRRGEWPGAAHAAVSGDDQAAREPGRDQQPQVRDVLTARESQRRADDRCDDLCSVARRRWRKRQQRLTVTTSRPPTGPLDAVDDQRAAEEVQCRRASASPASTTSRSSGRADMASPMSRRARRSLPRRCSRRRRSASPSRRWRR